MKREEKRADGSRAIIVGIQGTERQDVAADSLAELRELVETVGFEVVGEVFQRRETVHPAHFVGKGKVEELRELVREEHATVVVFDAELNPRQDRNLERMLEAEVQDRSEIILAIFARRAKTAQAKLQVELARTEYTLPRLRNMWTHFTRTEGRVGVRAGAGEKQLEEDLRLTRRRIHALRKSLREIERRKHREVEQRSDRFTVSLVGYTNVGKSTLMNRLTRANSRVEDKLFATLDTRTRVWNLAEGRRVLLSDTVGFLRRLPHGLIASFHATLEETLTADLLLHVVDASHPFVEAQVAAVEGVLFDLGVGETPRIIVLNKIDRVESPLDLRAVKAEYPDHVSVSAKRGTGLDRLAERVEVCIDEQREEFEVFAPIGEGRLFSALARHGTILDRENPDGDGRMRVRVRMSWADAGKLRKQFDGNRIDFHRIAN